MFIELFKFLFTKKHANLNKKKVQITVKTVF